MAFPQYSYKNLTFENKSEWPIDDWCKMVNDSYSYCMNLPLDRVLEFEGKCRLIDLPSHHPVWRILVAIDKRNTQRDIIKRKDECKKHPFLLPHYFNRDMTFEELDRIIESYEKHLKILSDTPEWIVSRLEELNNG